MKSTEFQKNLVLQLLEDLNLIFRISRHKSIKELLICKSLIMRSFALLAKSEHVFTWKKRVRLSRITIKERNILINDINKIF